jgi:PAS domain S-box-containing protein
MLEEARSHYENELLQAMEEAKSNSERFRALVDSLPDMVLRLSPEGLILDIKTQDPSDLAIPASELLGQHFSALEWPEDFTQALQTEFAGATGDPTSIEFSREDSQGFRHFEARLVKTGEREWVVYVRNVTSRKRLEEQQRSNLEYLKNLNRELIDQRFALDRHAIVAVTDLKGTITYVNDLMCKISGYSREELIGQNHSLLNSGYHPPEFFTGMWKTISAGKVWQNEIRNRRKDGSYYWVSSTLVPFRDASGKPKQYMAIRHDITALKEAEAAVRKQADALKLQNLELEEARDLALASTRAKSDFLATMSHEIRTPMNGVLGMTGLLLDTDLTSLQKEYGLTIQQSAESLLTLINDILDFSKIEAGKLDIEPIPFWLEGCCQEVCDLLAFRADQAGVKLMMRLQPGIPKMIMGDPGRLRQILLNLAGNALKFTQKGHVLIEIGCSSLLSDGRYEFFFAVQDSGIGLSPEAQARLFQPFSQADASTTRKFGGTGLGLAICKRLVEIMNGEIGVESTLGEGSTFWFRVTLPPAPEPDWTPAADVNLTGIRGLVVDDHAIDAQISIEVLTGLGLRVEVAVDGEKGLTAILEADAAGDPFEIALIDWTMPRLDGEGLGLALMNRELKAVPTLVMLTAAANRGDAHRMKKAGFTGFLVKPVGADILGKVIRECFRRRRLGSGMDELVTRHSVTETDAVRTAIKDDAKVIARVLLVEDNAVNQKVAAQILKKIGCRVEVAANGAEGFSMVKEMPFDIVLMDCQMPEMDGFESTRRIREWEKLGRGHIPIVAMTANAMQGDRERCLESGMDDYLSKPIKASLLREALIRNLEPAELRAESDNPPKVP